MSQAIPEDSDRGDLESVDKFAHDFVQQVRSGKQPSASDLQKQYPEVTEDIGGLAKTLSILEEASIRRVRERRSDTVVSASGRRQRVLGGYRLVREISRGGMGIVYEAEQESLKRRVAVKVLPPSPLLTEVERERFQREGFAVARLHHSNIVPVFGTGEQDGVQYCVMQFIDGFSLDRILADMRVRFGLMQLPLDEETAQSSGDGSGDLAIEMLLSPTPIETGKSPDSSRHDSSRPSEASAASSIDQITDIPNCYWRNVAHIGARVASALHHAHQQGVLHRDIKPGNLLLDRDGQIWLTDFGLAKLHDKESLTVAGNLVGTLRYTAPEQFEGEADERSDIYGLGLTLFEMCTFEPAFSATDRRELMRQVMTKSPTRPRSLNPRIPRDLETIILKSIAPEPENRYQSAADQAADLRSFLDDRPLIARRETAWNRSWRWCRRHPAETSLAAFALAMLLLFSVTATLAYFREASLRQATDADLARTREALDRVYDSFLPDWTTASTVSAHGMVSVSPDSARLLEELVEYYDEIASRTHRDSRKEAVLESAAAQRRVGLIYLRLGQLKQSRRAYTRAHARLDRFYQENPSTDLRLEQAKVLNELASVFWTARRFGAARNHQLQALSLIYETMPALDDDAAVKFELARTLYLLGRRGRGIGGGVMRHFERAGNNSTPLDQVGFVARATAILESLLSRHPENFEARYLLALCYREHADRAIDDTGEPIDASMREAIQILEVLVQAIPDHPTYRYALCTTLQWCRLDENASEDVCNLAAARMQRSAELAEQLSRQRPDEWIYAAARVEALIKMANVLNRGNNQEEALRRSQQAIDSASELSAKFRDCEIFQLWAGHARRRRGDLLRKTDDHESTLTQYDLAIVDLEKLLQNESSDFTVPVLRDLQRASEGRASVFDRLEDTSSAEAARRQAEAYAQRYELALNRPTE